MKKARSLVSRMWLRLCSHWIYALVGLLAFAILQRMTFQDSVRGLDFLFYALPYPVILISSGALGLYLMWTKRRLLAAATILIGCVAIPLWLQNSFVRNHPADSSSDFVVQYWNAARAKNAKAVLAGVTERGGDIIALVEAGADRLTTSTWKTHLPGYEVRKLEGGMVLAVRGAILDVKYTSVGSRRARFNTALVEVCGESTRTVHLILVDIHSSPFINKNRAFDELVSLIGKYHDNPLIIAGDFNTPLESVQFRKLRKAGMSHAFEESGNGFVETYLFNLPILAIDHIWVNKHLRPVSTMKGMARGSDHQPLITRMAVRK